MGAIAPIDFEEVPTGVPLEGSKLAKLARNIGISTHRLKFLKTPLYLEASDFICNILLVVAFKMTNLKFGY